MSSTIQLLLLAIIFTADTFCSNDLILSDKQDDDISTPKSDIDKKPLKTFVPTKDWKVVHDDEAIPAGLHVRMNFQTGVKEAKLLDKTDSNDESKSSSTNTENENEESSSRDGPKIILSEEGKSINEFPKNDDKIYFTKSHLKEALKEFRDKVGNKDVEEISWNDHEYLKGVVPDKNVKKKFRNIEEIRNELEDTMGWKIKSDIQIMKDHVAMLKTDGASASEIGTTLDNLEYYVHQIDNGKDLVRIDGMRPIVMLLNQSNEVLQEKAANVIGAAAQSNEEVQTNVVDNGGLMFLLRMLNTKKLPLTKKKGLYALSAVVRGNTNAQQKLARLDGFSRLIQIIQDEKNSPLRVKAVTFLFDLIVEQNERLENLVKQGKKKPGERLPLMELLVENDWCNLLPPLLKSDDYDTVEKVLQAINVSFRSCQTAFKKHSNIFKVTKERLAKDIHDEDDKDFKNYLESLEKSLSENIVSNL